MTQRYSQDLKMLLEFELQKNEQVQAAVASYWELTEEERALFRLAAGISQDTSVRTREPWHRSTSDMSEGTQPGQGQPIVRDLMNRDYTQNILGLQLGGFPLLRRREAGRRGSDNDRHNRFYAKLYADRFYVCSQWWRDDHLDNARSLLRFVDQLAGRDPNHIGIPELERHMKSLRDYINRSA